MSNEAWPVHNLAIATVASMQKWERKPADFYATPEECTQALIDALALPKGTLIREPACGDGKLSRVLKLAGMEVISSDLHYRGYGEQGIDFLTADKMGSAAWTMTNPPFNLAEEFIRKALTQTPNVAMLLKSNYWHAGRCLSLFETHRPTMEYRLCWRPAFLKDERGNNPLMDVSWVIWRAVAGGQAGWRPLRKPKVFPTLRPLLEPAMVDLGDALDEMIGAVRART